MIIQTLTNFTRLFLINLTGHRVTGFLSKLIIDARLQNGGTRHLYPDGHAGLIERCIRCLRIVDASGRVGEL